MFLDFYSTDIEKIEFLKSEICDRENCNCTKSSTLKLKMKSVDKEKLKDGFDMSGVYKSFSVNYPCYGD